MPKTLSKVSGPSYTPERHIVDLHFSLHITKGDDGEVVNQPIGANAVCTYVPRDDDGKPVSDVPWETKNFSLGEDELKALPDFAVLYGKLSTIFHAKADEHGF